MALDVVPDFVVNTSQDICELVLTGIVDLASKDGRAAAAIAHRTYIDRRATRAPLRDSQALETTAGVEAFQEIVAFVMSWTDAVLQASPLRAEWMDVRQRELANLLCNLAATARFSDPELRLLDALIARRSLEYGPSPFDSGVALAVHLGPTFGADAFILGMSAGAFVTGASVELLREIDPRDADG